MFSQMENTTPDNEVTFLGSSSYNVVVFSPSFSLFLPLDSLFHTFLTLVSLLLTFLSLVSLFLTLVRTGPGGSSRCRWRERERKC